jgi:hypothetical protein
VSRIKTWQTESILALAVLSGVAAFGGNHVIEWIGVGAVWLSFMHGQVSDRMVERQASLVTPDVHCWRWSRLYFVGKELLWVAYFLEHHSYAALVGCGLFLVYPIWRAWYRKRRPLGRQWSAT